MTRSVIVFLLCLSLNGQLLIAQTTVKGPIMPVSKAVPELVQTASKKEENIQKAPTTIVVITRKQMIERGYVDIVDAIQDLPGFDVNKIYSKTYANLFQLGLRQDNTERTLLMVDGLEENDLWSNSMYLSRQYPLSMIKAIEVLYGPATALYGSRAMIGAINIITMDPDQGLSDPLFENSVVKKTNGNIAALSMYGSLLQGGFNSKSADLTMNIKGKTQSNFSIQLTGRYFRSDEHRMNGEFYDYDISDIDSFRYTKLDMTNTSWNGGLNKYMSGMRMPMVSPYYQVRTDNLGNITMIRLTQVGIDRARQLDKVAYTGSVNGAPVGYSNASEDYFVGMKIKISDFTLGIRHWKLQEGINAYQDIYEAGTANGSVWAPTNTSFYAQAKKKIGERSEIFNLTSFSVHGLGKESNRVNFMSFGDPSTKLHFAHLLYPDSLIIGMRGPIQDSLVNNGTDGTQLERFSRYEHGWRNRYYYYQAVQARNEFRYYYTGKNKKFNLTAGADLRYSQLPGNYLIYQDFDTKIQSQQAFKNKQQNVSLAKELGIVDGLPLIKNTYDAIDIGLFAQLYYSFSDRFSIAAGARRDQQIIRRSVGFGNRISPTLTLMYQSSHLLNAKLIYSRGIQSASQQTRYSREEGFSPNPSLGPESIDHLSVEWSGRNKRDMGLANLSWNLVSFWYKTHDGIATSTTPIKMNINSDSYQVKGIMASLTYRLNVRLLLNANHSFVSAFRNSSISQSSAVNVRLGDIASHHINVGLTHYFENAGPFRMSLNLRSNYVAGRKVGVNTSVPKNLGVNSTGTIPDYLIINGNLGLALRSFSVLRLDLSVENIMGTTYYHAGPGQADATFNLAGGVRDAAFINQQVPYMSQRGRFIRFRLTYSLFGQGK